MLNAHEERNRAAKVEKLMAKIPVGKTADECRIIAEWVEGLNQEQRVRFADHAGIPARNAPSTETWDEVHRQVRARCTVEQALAAAGATP